MKAYALALRARAVKFIQAGGSNAFMEGLNSVFSATKRTARGHRSANLR